MVLDTKRALGQFDTPADVADLLVGFCLRGAADRVLDPSCGRGAFLARVAAAQQWLAEDPGHRPHDTLYGVELDPVVAALAREQVPAAAILCANFLTLEADGQCLFDAVVGNPPYTRAEWLTGGGDTTGDPGAAPLAPAGRKVELGGRAGLHAFFILYATSFLREGGRFGFVVPNSWLDVAYGEGLKQFLLDHTKIVAIVESTDERWFADAKVNTCLLILEKCGDAESRAMNRVRLARLRRPLAELLPPGREHFGHVERLVGRLMASRDHTGADLEVQVVAQRELAAGQRWGVALRAPAVYRRRLGQEGLAPLAAWARVQRGYTTGANAFFYLDPPTVERWSIEGEYRRPLLKSLRGRCRFRIESADCQAELLAIPPAADLAGSGAGAYVAWGESQGLDRRRTCRGRRPWYSLPEQEAADLLLAKGIWARHFAPLVEGRLVVDQQLYCIRLAEGVPRPAAAALLNSSWFALQLELQGRVNFGEGVLWLATYEVEQTRLPDPRRLPGSQLSVLVDAFAALATRAVEPTAAEVSQVDRQALDEAVWSALGVSQAEAQQLQAALLERLAVRHRLADQLA
jgi:hypothetical protein